MDIGKSEMISKRMLDPPKQDYQRRLQVFEERVLSAPQSSAVALPGGITRIV